MKFQVKKANGEVVRRTLKLTKIADGEYRITADGKTDLGTIRKADGRVKNFRRGLLDGTKTVPRWFAQTNKGIELGEKFPYDEGFATRFEALTELLEATLGLRRDW